MCIMRRMSPQGDGSREPTALDRECASALDALRALANGNGKAVHAVVRPDSDGGTVCMAWTSDNALSLALDMVEGVALDGD